MNDYEGYQSITNKVYESNKGHCFKDGLPTKQVFNKEHPRFSLCGSKETCVYKENISHKVYCTYSLKYNQFEEKNEH